MPMTIVGNIKSQQSPWAAEVSIDYLKRSSSNNITLKILLVIIMLEAMVDLVVHLLLSKGARNHGNSLALEMMVMRR